jgi:vacuolar-type H+-ATPase subunit I/STV1
MIATLLIAVCLVNTPGSFLNKYFPDKSVRNENTILKARVDSLEIRVKNLESVVDSVAKFEEKTVKAFALLAQRIDEVDEQTHRNYKDGKKARTLWKAFGLDK